MCLIKKRVTSLAFFQGPMRINRRADLFSEVSVLKCTFDFWPQRYKAKYLSSFEGFSLTSRAAKHGPKNCNFHYTTYPRGVHVLYFIGLGLENSLCFIYLLYYLLILLLFAHSPGASMRAIWLISVSVSFEHTSANSFFVTLIKNGNEVLDLGSFEGLTVWIINILRSGLE